jgi:hypothetical protein
LDMILGLCLIIFVVCVGVVAASLFSCNQRARDYNAVKELFVTKIRPCYCLGFYIEEQITLGARYFTYGIRIRGKSQKSCTIIQYFTNAND